MPILASLFTSLFSGLAGLFAITVSRKVAFGFAAIGTFATLTVALYGAIGVLYTGVTSMIPVDSAILMGMWVATPDNAQSVIAATIACDSAIALYRWNVENVRLLAYVT